MVVNVRKPFCDVMGVPHKTGDTLIVTEKGYEKYKDYVERAEDGRKRTSKSRKAKSSAED